MTDRRALDQRDPHPAPEWAETSSAGIRRMALQAAEAAVRKAKEGRCDCGHLTDHHVTPGGCCIGDCACAAARRASRADDGDTTGRA